MGRGSKRKGYSQSGGPPVNQYGAYGAPQNHFPPSQTPQHQHLAPSNGQRYSSAVILSHTMNVPYYQGGNPQWYSGTVTIHNSPYSFVSPPQNHPIFVTPLPFLTASAPKNVVAGVLVQYQVQKSQQYGTFTATYVQAVQGKGSEGRLRLTKEGTKEGTNEWANQGTNGLLAFCFAPHLLSRASLATLCSSQPLRCDTPFNNNNNLQGGAHQIYSVSLPVLFRPTVFLLLLFLSPLLHPLLHRSQQSLYPVRSRAYFCSPRPTERAKVCLLIVLMRGKLTWCRLR